MACEREFVALRSRDAETLRHALGGKAHREIRVGIMIDEPGVGRNLVAAHGDHRHGFCSAGNDDFGAARLNSLGGHGDGLQPGRAEAIDRHGRDFNGQAGAEGGDAGDVHPLLAFRHGAAEDDVFDFLRIKLRHALERGLDGDGREIVGTGGAEGAFEGASNGSAECGSDYDVSHVSSRLITAP